MSTTVSPYVTVPQEVAMTYVQEHVTSLSQTWTTLCSCRLLIRKKLKIKGVAIGPLVSRHGDQLVDQANALECIHNASMDLRLTDKYSIIFGFSSSGSSSAPCSYINRA